MSAMILGFLKVALVLLVDFAAINSVFQNPAIALGAVGLLSVYILFGGYLALLREGAVHANKLPRYQQQRLEMARQRLVRDVQTEYDLDISSLRVYLVPGDDAMNATAYGCNCVSVTQGSLANADPIMLTGVLAHEASHIVSADPEFNRAVFASVTLVLGMLSVVSFATVAVIFLLFLLLSCFRSWLGVMVFRGTAKAVSGLFGLIQRGIVVFYRAVLGLFSRHAEYRCDRFAAQLGYGTQLAHFLLLADPGSTRPMTLLEAIYRSHPPTVKRLARLEQLPVQRLNVSTPSGLRR